ncbi:hypothetical protein CDAR_478041 [Caerostris darwini]|uniref:Uncharacterized protein n=1 Tax=Caerostris darwini TaxID=1538125 RepID=A0AAV4MCI1_9ARAC|nr:hypothetical protein CDAR_478041 [Caerostris darwini]
MGDVRSPHTNPGDVIWTNPIILCSGRLTIVTDEKHSIVFRSSDCASETANQSEMAIAQANEREKKPCHFSGRHSRVCRNRECFFLERVPVNESSRQAGVYWTCVFDRQMCFCNRQLCCFGATDDFQQEILFFK